MTQAGGSGSPILNHKKDQETGSPKIFVNKAGVQIIQENGQRKYGPPPDWQDPLPAKGSEIFIGKLPRDIFEDELIPLFQKIGKIYEFRLMMDFENNNRGYAFVVYSSPDEAKRAVKELDNHEVRKGRFIGVCKSVDNCRLFVGGIPKTKTKEEILEEMRRVTDAVSDVILYSSIEDKSKNRGFAFVEYESHKAAAIARRKLMPGKIQLFGHDVAVDWAEPELEVDEDTMAKVTVLYVRNLMSDTTEDSIKDIFSMKGDLKIDKVKKLRDFAFIHFKHRNDAEQALQQFNGLQLDGAIIEVTWAKPVDKAFRMRSRSIMPSTPLPAYGHYMLGFDQYGGHIPFPPPLQLRPPPVLQRVPLARRGRGAAGIRRYKNFVPNNRSANYKPVEVPMAMPSSYPPYQGTKLSRIPEEGKNYHGTDYMYVPATSSSSDDTPAPPTATGPAIATYPGHARIAHHSYIPIPGYEDTGYYAFVPAYPPLGVLPMH